MARDQLKSGDTVRWRYPPHHPAMHQRRVRFGDGPFTVTLVYPEPGSPPNKQGSLLCDLVSTIDPDIQVLSLPETAFVKIT